ncbi:MAG TPA: Cache 3/Cache 2 fusion domain-containing protein, partial [Bacteroidales bacterium]
IDFLPKKISVSAENQITGKFHSAYLQVLKVNGNEIYGSQEFPEMTHQLFGGTTTIFQKIDSGFIRVSTNVKNDEGIFAVGTFIPNNSPVIKTIEKGETYYGRAFVVNDWYITAYEPIYDANEIVGILYVGNQEKDIEKLKEILQGITIGETGNIFVLDETGELLVPPKNLADNLLNTTVFEKISYNKNGVSSYNISDGKEILLAYTYYNDFEVYIAAQVPLNELTALPLRNIIVNAVIVGLLAAILFIIIILTTTTRRIHRFLNAIKLSNVKLQTAKAELEQTKENFKTLFNNSSDEIIVSDMNMQIIEVNQVACESLGYTRDELLKLTLKDLKSERYKYQVVENREIVLRDGSYTFESEHISKSGEIVPVEIKSRLFEYLGQKAVLSIARTITERKELERKVLSAVITTEERERERFAKDMHDGLGPLLSTIKLYVNELNGDDTSSEEKDGYIKEINKMLDEAVTSTREISNNLMPRVIKEYGLMKAIDSFCQKVNNMHKLDIQLENDGIEETLDKDLQLILFRVISELINNSLKHANAKNISIKLKKNDDKISLAFEDDGIGFNMSKVMNNKQTGIGLKSIISRVKSVNGQCIFKSMEGHGFKIYIDI